MWKVGLLAILFNLSTSSTVKVCQSELCDNEIRTKYEPTWDSLDTRPLPEWYDDAKVGIFIHWGVYSVPSFGTEWFWTNWQGSKVKSYVDFMTENYKPDFTYQDFASDFTAELFNASEWAQLFADSGARYVVLISKHHDGYALWPSRYSFSWNAQDVGPKRNIIGELASAIRSDTSIHFGLYYSLFEWFNRMYLDDKLHLFLRDEYVQNKVLPELHELIETFHPDVLWSDGDWEAPPPYWNATEFIAWLYNDSPVRDTIVTNDRWGIGTACTHGDFYTCRDRYNPGVLQKHKWENALTIDKTSWGHRSDTKLKNFLSAKELITELVTTVSCGGNMNVNVGPTKAGTIEVIFEERLRQMGKWLSINGEAIYSSKPWKYQNDTVTKGVWYTTTKSDNSSDRSHVYAMILDYPYDTNTIDLCALGKVVDSQTKIKVLGVLNENVKWKSSKDCLNVILPPKNIMDKNGLDYAWTLKINIPK
ncbi:unnamed protein product [Hermetia illucens]|uniref:Putative alpha-L-fucosidase n=1 Tax=Hermetia illucens TaxID=343691 RepID=A0A7R8YQT3_HERIL|nr:putative alpha-L-fucosidase [Hermetia illucens]CAD7082191.1 unnamed protein product [Hermetia illucens]